jgi:hypothetical protein
VEYNPVAGRGIPGTKPISCDPVLQANEGPAPLEGWADPLTAFLEADRPYTRSCRVGRERISATASGTAMRAPSTAATIESGKHRLNFRAVSISSGSEGQASAGLISAIARATVSVLVARTNTEKSSHRAEA